VSVVGGECGVSVFRQVYYMELDEETARGFGPDNEENMIPWETEDSELYYDL
jgi:hypothetical protein